MLSLFLSLRTMTGLLVARTGLRADLAPLLRSERWGCVRGKGGNLAFPSLIMQLLVLKAVLEARLKAGSWGSRQRVPPLGRRFFGAGWRWQLKSQPCGQPLQGNADIPPPDHTVIKNSSWARFPPSRFSWLPVSKSFLSVIFRISSVVVLVLQNGRGRRSSVVTSQFSVCFSFGSWDCWGAPVVTLFWVPAVFFFLAVGFIRITFPVFWL